MVWSRQIPLSEASSPGYRIGALVEDQGAKVAMVLKNRTIGRAAARGAGWAGGGTGGARQIGLFGTPRGGSGEGLGEPGQSQSRPSIVNAPACSGPAGRGECGCRTNSSPRTAWRPRRDWLYARCRRRNPGSCPPGKSAHGVKSPAFSSERRVHRLQSTLCGCKPPITP